MKKIFLSILLLFSLIILSISNAFALNVLTNNTEKMIGGKSICSEWGTITEKLYCNDDMILKKALYLNSEQIVNDITDFCLYNNFVIFSNSEKLCKYNLDEQRIEYILNDYILYDLSTYNNFLYAINNNGLSQLIVVNMDNYSVIETNYTNVNSYSFDNHKLVIDERFAESEITTDTIYVSSQSATLNAENINNANDGYNNITQKNDNDAVSIMSVNDEPILDSVVLFSAIQPALFVMDTLYVTQGAYGSYSHSDDNAFDLDGSLGGGRYDCAGVKAPFDGTVKYKETSYNAVWFQSNNIVQYANGTTGYMTVLFMHDMDINDVYVGQTVNQGTVFYHEGGKGPNGPTQYGTHLHLECMSGQVGSKGWGARGNVYPNDALYLLPSTNVSNRGGYSWKTWDGSTCTYADLGDDFYAVILNTEHWKTISLEDDQSVKIRPEDGTSKQVWRFKKQSDGSYLILSAKTGKALELYAGETADGTPVKACSEDWGGNYQRWYLYPQGNGYCIVSKHYSDTKNIAMDLSAAAAYDGTSVIGWKRYNGASQIWSIYSAQDVQLTAPNFSVNVDTSNQQAKFTWSEVYGESNYSVKIWKDKLYEGNVYKVCDTAVSGYSVSLPAGTYYAYVDAGNYFGWKQSNVVSFTVKATYKITYNANGGSNVPLSQIKVQNSPLKLSENSPSRSGYSFKGWNTKPDGSGTNYAPGASYSANSAITLYAQWTEHLNVEPGIYKIHSAVNDNMVFDIEGDSKESGANIQLYKNDDNPVKYFRLIKYTDYYVIQSVYSGMFLDIHTPIEDASNIWLYKTYTNPEEKWVFEDAGDGYVYIRSITGYYVDIDGNRAENHVNVLAYHFTGNTVQKWRLERQYTISYNANDGNSVPSSQTKAQNISIKLSESIPSRLGYSFIGWNTISDGSGIFYSPGDTYSENADITLYAQWKKIEPSTSSTVKQIDNSYIVNIEFINVQNGKTVICAGYKENRFVTAQIEEYSENFNPIILTGDIDTVKIMIWDDVSNIMPVTKVEEIPSSKWVKEQI